MHAKIIRATKSINRGVLTVKPKKFRLFDAVLMAVVVILVVESVAPASAIGPSQFFLWIFLLFFFFIPYGLISSELGTAFPDTGGLYAWVKSAFGKRWGGRLAWLYWISYPIWIMSVAVIFAQTAATVFGFRLNGITTILLQLLFIWTVVFIGNKPVADSKWIMNLAAFAKIFIIVALAVLGIYVASTKGVANSFTLKTMLPQTNLSSLSNVSIIVFNFLGFEVVTTMAGDMDNPKKQIPQAIIFGGLLIAGFYLLAAFGIGVAIPADKLSASSGLLSSFTLLIGHANWFTKVIGALFLYSLISEMVSWALGINYVANYAAKDHTLPHLFSVESHDKMPVGTGYLNGLVATILVVVSPLIPNQDLFQAFFELNVITLLLAYAMLFPAFLKLRKTQPTTPRPFKIPGGRFVVAVITWVPETLLILSILLTIVPLTTNEIPTKLPILIGTVIALIIGEVVVRISDSHISLNTPALEPVKIEKTNQ
ncbi:amino acid transporter [Secundilactobacillus collinoides DSM 20515 = JCM 1123]|uniref:Amino acid transporter n=1 Tax=Secundilactobacillus collinoides DSM 20515 = JCM 1123 TaxID=1423733 RepID=A0A0R2B578_SECCO|nr:amino acid transporter [Secundilactobacillus collinoides DSM 20515 = JCM 1123]